MPTRRALLIRGAGAAAVVLTGVRAWDRGVWSGGKGPAYLPWSDWQGNTADGIKRPLRAAILASNPHDTQPWLFEALQNQIIVFLDVLDHESCHDVASRHADRPHMAMSRVFSITMIEMMLKMSNPATTRIDVVVRQMILSCGENVCRHQASPWRIQRLPTLTYERLTSAQAMRCAASSWRRSPAWASNA
jgi:hypothetical protein